MGDCTICLETLTGPLGAFKCECTALYHWSCIKGWREGCPVCRGGGKPRRQRCKKVSSLVEALSEASDKAAVLELENSGKDEAIEALRLELAFLRSKGDVAEATAGQSSAVGVDCHETACRAGSRSRSPLPGCSPFRAKHAGRLPSSSPSSCRPFRRNSMSLSTGSPPPQAPVFEDISNIIMSPSPMTPEGSPLQVPSTPPLRRASLVGDHPRSAENEPGPSTPPSTGWLPPDIENGWAPRKFAVGAPRRYSSGRASRRLSF